MTALWLALAGAGGAIARYLGDLSVQGRHQDEWPWGTLVVNVSGCLLLGVIWGWVDHHPADASLRTIGGTGFVGAYTTFSAFSLETVRLLETGRYGAAARYVGASLVVGALAAAVGLALGG